MNSIVRAVQKKNLVKIAVISLFFAGFSVHAAEEKAPMGPEPKGARNFYQVLEEVLADFEYDLKSGQVLGLKDLAIRNTVTSENVPASFRNHLELLLTERILKNTKARIVNCLACKSKKAVLNKEAMVISSPENNIPELQRIAKMNGIFNFLDVAYAYQPSGMILGLQISDVETGTLLWSRTYNSENTRAQAVARGVDYQDATEAKTRMEYAPTIQMRPILYTVMAPKANSGYATALGLGFRMMERYDNRQKEVGFEANYYMDIPKLTGQASATTDKGNIYTGLNLTFLFMHGWSLFGFEENYNRPRAVIYGGIGGTYASGFLGGVLRGVYEWRLGKRWAVNSFLGYRPKGTVVITSGTEAPLSGLEGGVGVGYLF